MEFLTDFLNIILHLDVHLNAWVAQFGIWMYVILFIIIFCETGLVVTPFLPGDSLLFALGALAASPDSVLKLIPLALTLIIAGIIGDAVNYSIGRFLGPKVFQSKSKFFKEEYLIKTQGFYEKHGGKTIILARYVPIVRTFAPFVAGIGEMSYPKFFAYNVIGAISWVLIFLCAGYYFGNLPTVKHNFHLVIIGIIIVSVLPMAFEFLKAKMNKGNA